MEAMEVRVSCPQEGMSELRKRSWFLERLNRLRERVNARDAVREVKDGGNKKASPFEGGRGCILIVGTPFHFERIRHQLRLQWLMLSLIAGCHAVSLSYVQADHIISKSVP